MKKLLTFVFIGWTTAAAFGQMFQPDPHRADSLRQLLTRKMDDTTRLKRLGSLSESVSRQEREAVIVEAFELAERVSSRASASEAAFLDSEAGRHALFGPVYLYQMRGKNELAIQFAQRASQACQHQPQSPLFFEAKLAEANILMNLGQLDPSITILNDLFPLAEKQNLIARFNFSMQLHESYRRKGDMVNAAKWGYRSLEIAEKSALPLEVAAAYSELATDYLYLKDAAQALVFIEKGLKITENQPNSDILRLDLCQRAFEANSLKNDWSSAKKWAEASLDIAQKIQAQQYEIQSLQFLANAERHLGQSANALVLLHQALEKLQSDSLSKDANEVFIQLGETFLLTNEPQKALVFAQKAARAAAHSSFANTRFTSLDLLQRAYRANKNEAQALIFYEKSIKLRDSIQSEDNQRAVIRKQIEVDFQQKETQSRTWRNGLLAAAAALLLLVVGWAVWNRLRQQRQLRLAAEKAENEQRLRVVSELEALRAQMNPHFVFNSLSTLESFILENRNAEATGLLQKFSRLTRLVLENSARPLVSLEDDLTALKLYVELEETRFNHSFRVEWNLAADVLEENPAVPPLLVQPFVENAILHGLRAKKGANGLLKISLSKQENNLLFLIEDTGVGRRQAEKLAPPKPVGQTSMGGKLTERRIELFNQTNRRAATVVVEDLFPEKEDAGTRVELRLPV